MKSDGGTVLIFAANFSLSQPQIPSLKLQDYIKVVGKTVRPLNMLMSMQTTKTWCTGSTFSCNYLRMRVPERIRMILWYKNAAFSCRYGICD